MELTIQHIGLEGDLENYNLSLNSPAKSYAKRKKVWMGKMGHCVKCEFIIIKFGRKYWPLNNFRVSNLRGKNR